MTRQISIITGLLLFVFVAIHLTNLAIGVFSIQLAEDLRPRMMLLFSNPVGGIVLAICAISHMLLGLYSLYQRNTLRLSAHDAVQLATALLIPLFLLPHAFANVMGGALLDIKPTYFDLFKLMWIDKPLSGLSQVVLVVVIWIHGCIGLFTWLKLQSWWPRVSLISNTLAVLIPVLALLAFVEGGNTVLQQLSAKNKQAANASETVATPSFGQYGATDDYSSSADSSYTESNISRTYSGNNAYPQSPDSYPSGEDELSNKEKHAVTLAYIKMLERRLVYGYLGLLLIVLLARWFRLKATDQYVEVHYDNGEIFRSRVGLSLLEIANISDKPHANLCRGRARCGTCRVRILHTDRALDPPSAIEQKTLGRTGSEEDIRLACQLVPHAGVLKIKNLLPPDIQPHQVFGITQDSVLEPVVQEAAAERPSI